MGHKESNQTNRRNRVSLKDVLKNLILKKKLADDMKGMKNYPACKEEVLET